MPHIVVLGGGPGGYGAAFEAAKLGAQVTLIERKRLGGTCLNVGCIPTKTMLRTAAIAKDVREAELFGLRAMDAPLVDVDALRTRKQTVVDELVSQIESTVKRLSVEVISGVGRLTSSTSVNIETSEGMRSIEADAIIIATGSKVFKLPSIDHELDCVWTSDEAIALNSIPASMLIIGGGIIGSEFACAYAAFGTRVTVVELADTIIPGNDKRVTRTLATALAEQGIDIRTKTSVETVEQTPSGVGRAILSNGEVIEAEIILSAVGRIPNTEGFGFEEAGLEFDRRAIKTDKFFRTNLDKVYAVGDAIGGMMLAHVAEREGIAAAKNLMADFAGDVPFATVDPKKVAACVYTFPEVGVVGYSAESAKAAQIPTVSGVFKFTGNGKALSIGESVGSVEIIAEKETGRIIGGQIVGPHAVELITEISNAVASGHSAAELAAPVYAHPTCSEAVMVAAELCAAKLER